MYVAEDVRWAADSQQVRLLVEDSFDFADELKH